MKKHISKIALVVLGLVFSAGVLYAAEVNGIYTEPTTKDVGELTGISFLKGIKVRGWIDFYYEYNFNDPSHATVNAIQNGDFPGIVSVIRAGNLTIEGRTFDVHSNSFGFNLAEIEIEKVPERGGVGFDLKLAFGDTPEIIFDTIEFAIGDDTLVEAEKFIEQASISYLAPIGRGLRIDVGKFVTHIGGETIETIKNNNYSHSFFYTYAIPFQDTGIRFNYPWTDTVYTELYVLNGWNATIDNNEGKTIGPSIGWAPSPKFAWYINGLFGPEQTDNNSNFRYLFDTQMFINPLDKLNILLNFDYGFEENAPLVSGVVKNVQWVGVAGVIRYKVTDNFEPAFRAEYYNDVDGFTTALKQQLVGLTLTLNFRIGTSKYANILLRPEFRYDRSNEKFFTDDNDPRAKKSQTTIGAGATFYF